jgi:hypothetical protein
MSIDAIYVATHKLDVHLTRICVASIRYWYPTTPVYLIKDYLNGNFSTEEIEKTWSVLVYATSTKRFGWGFSKLEPLFTEPGKRFLILDSDTVLAGPLLDSMDDRSEEFLVHLEPQGDDRAREIYFDRDELARLDPSFAHPRELFNSGQLIATGGRVSREDFSSVAWTSPRALKFPRVFRNGDQGVLNYVLLKKRDAGDISLGSAPLMRWTGDGIEDVDLSLLRSNSPYRFVIHWAGMTSHSVDMMTRSDILRFFEDFYYSRVRFAAIKRRARAAIAPVSRTISRIERRIGRP